jgi:sialate O-acetylesterase
LVTNRCGNQKKWANISKAANKAKEKTMRKNTAIIVMAFALLAGVTQAALVQTNYISDDALVRGGTYTNNSNGTGPYTLARNSNSSDARYKTYLRADLTSALNAGEKFTNSALKLTGYTNGAVTTTALTYRVYGITDNDDAWIESDTNTSIQIKWSNAPKNNSSGDSVVTTGTVLLATFTLASGTSVDNAAFTFSGAALDQYLNWTAGAIADPYGYGDSADKKATFIITMATLSGQNTQFFSAESGGPGVELQYSAVSILFAPLFNDGAVLQCEMPVNIWGTAAVGAIVTVSFAGQEKETVTGADGCWLVKLDPMEPSSEARTLTCFSSTGSSVVSNVTVGEVWLATGQSNMVLPLQFTTGGAQRLAQTRSGIRFSVVPKQLGLPPQPFTSEQLAWKTFAPTNNRQIAAVAFYFAEKLQAEIGGQVGIIQSSYGGSSAEAWTPEWALDEKPELTYLADAIRSGLAPPDSQTSPTVLYENMIRPIIPYTARGVIWYQGESNARKPDEYRILFPTMINAWRTLWNRPDWPFFFVQLSAYDNPNDWPGLRAAQTFTRDTVLHTGMALSIDHGEKENIHPAAKQPVGERLALLALDQVYGRDVVSRGPAFQTLGKSVDNSVRVTFQYSEDGLKTSDGLLDVAGFELAGPDGSFYPASARIVSKDTVELTCTEVQTPVSIRYAWASWIEPQVTLVNSAGLPAEPGIFHITINGTPYLWMDQYGLTNYVADDVLDQDADGLKTWQEYIAGTNPTNAASVLKAAQAVSDVDVVTWTPVIAGRVYSVHWSTNLLTGFTNLADDIVLPQGSYTNMTPDAKMNCYKIKVRLP